MPFTTLQQRYKNLDRINHCHDLASLIYICLQFRCYISWKENIKEKNVKKLFSRAEIISTTYCKILNQYEYALILIGVFLKREDLITEYLIWDRTQSITCIYDHWKCFNDNYQELQFSFRQSNYCTDLHYPKVFLSVIRIDRFHERNIFISRWVPF